MQGILSNTAVELEQHSRLKLFSGSIEIWILLLPFLALPAFLFEQVSGVQWSLLDWNISSFLVSSVGLSGIHNYFTLVMLFGLPEFQKWSAEQVAQQPWLFRLRVYGVTLAIFLLTLIVYNFWGSAETWGIWIGVGFTVISAHHSFSQSLGLSQAYTEQLFRQPDLLKEERKKLARYQTFEIKIKKLLVPIQFIWAVTIFLPYLGMQAVPELAALIPLRVYALSSLLILMGLFLVNCVLISSLRPTNKLWFSLRILLYACATGSGSLALVFFLRLVHGIEYWGVFQAVTERSAAEQKVKSKLFWSTLLLALVGFVLMLFRRQDGFYYFFAGDPLQTHWLVPLLAAVSLAMTHIHFFLDGLLFRMRDPISRKWIAPLLTQP